MSYSPKVHHRQSIRLRGYDYSKSGWYFVTVCSYQRRKIFGEIINNQMLSSPAGKIAESCWRNIACYSPLINLHDFIVMPNHLHGIIQLVGAPFIAPNSETMLEEDMGQGTINQGAIKLGAINRAPTVGEIVRRFKARCSWEINRTLQMQGVPVWQRNYHEHIIRNESALIAISDYVRTNPLRWIEDRYNC